jgi:hypothetical protein
VSTGDTKANTRELVRAPGGPLERTQRGVALQALRNRSSSLGAESVVIETASMGAEVGLTVSMGADTKFGGWFELQAAYSSDCSVVLPLRPSARAAPPLGPRLFNERLRAWERVRVLRVSMGADSARKRTLWGSSALETGDHRLLEDGSECGGALDSDAVDPQTARDGLRQ